MTWALVNRTCTRLEARSQTPKDNPQEVYGKKRMHKLGLTSELPKCHQSSDAMTSQSSFPSNSWWFQPTAIGILPRDDPIIIDWTPDATYEYLDVESEVGAWLHCQESYLRTIQKGKFFQHYRMPAGEDRTYSALHVPKAIWSDEDNSYCLVEAYALQAIKMRYHDLTRNIML